MPFDELTPVSFIALFALRGSAPLTYASIISVEDNDGYIYLALPSMVIGYQADKINDKVV